MFATDKGSLYLSTIRDCFDGMLVGYQTSIRPTMDLAEHTLLQACEKHYPRADGSLALHSDRGVHYRGRAWLGLTAKHNIARFMSK
ncbi:DDE-type integrase/transposase/recombinase [Schaalia cardiffensis]|uniref:DDE-type integrase/transposase/recombinase n=1 Tax=Schaalia cardiffensis TaxID=181487 RepID=UPI003CC83205